MKNFQATTFKSMGITSRQNHSDQLQLLAAQRNLYSFAKNVIGLQMLLTGPVAFATALIAVFFPELKAYAALCGLSVLVVDLTLLTPWQKKIRENAAKIQEVFDTTVLGVDWNELKVGKKPDPELIHEQAKKFFKNGGAVDSLKNWYPPAADSLPGDWGAVVCQRANVYWDSKLRRRYAGSVFVLMVLATLVLIWACFHGKSSLPDLVVYIAAPLASVYVLAYRQISEHREAADRLDKLKEHAYKLYGDAVEGASVASIRTRARNLQDEIYDGRKKNPPIFDFVFQMLRQKNESEMNEGAEALVKQAKAKVPV